MKNYGLKIKILTKMRSLRCDGVTQYECLFAPFCHNYNSTTTQFKLKKFFSPMKMTLNEHPPFTLPYLTSPLGIQCQQYLTCYKPDFNKSLKLCFWD